MGQQRITPERVRNIIQGAEMAGREVKSIEIDGLTVKLGPISKSKHISAADLVDMTQ